MRCPSCDILTPHGDFPETGDEFFCFHCLHTAVYDEAGYLRMPTDEEWGPILHRPVTRTIRAAMLAWRPVMMMQKHVR